MSGNEKKCSGCPEQGNCGEVYKKLGSIEGGSVLAGVFAAFLVPMLVFILSTAFFFAVLSRVVGYRAVLTVLVLLPAVFLTILSIFFGRMLIRKSAKRKGEIF